MGSRLESKIQSQGDLFFHSFVTLNKQFNISEPKFLYENNGHDGSVIEYSQTQ